MYDKLQNILAWIISNKEWLFSGLGIAFFSFLLNCFNKKKNNNGNNQSCSFNIGSKITQINGNSNVNGKESK